MILRGISSLLRAVVRRLWLEGWTRERELPARPREPPSPRHGARQSPQPQLRGRPRHPPGLGEARRGYAGQKVDERFSFPVGRQGSPLPAPIQTKEAPALPAPGPAVPLTPQGPDEETAVLDQLLDELVGPLQFDLMTLQTLPEIWAVQVRVAELQRGQPHGSGGRAADGEPWRETEQPSAEEGFPARRGKRRLSACCHPATCCPRGSPSRRSAASGSALCSSLPVPNFSPNLSRPGRGRPPPGAACSHARDAAPAVPAPPSSPPPPSRSALQRGRPAMGTACRDRRGWSAWSLLYGGLLEAQGRARLRDGEARRPQGQGGPGITFLV